MTKPKAKKKAVPDGPPEPPDNSPPPEPMGDGAGESPVGDSPQPRIPEPKIPARVAPTVSSTGVPPLAPPVEPRKRKRRSKKEIEAERQAEEQAKLAAEAAAQAEARAKRAESAKATATVLVDGLGPGLGAFLEKPPAPEKAAGSGFDPQEREALIGAWTPVIEEKGDVPPVAAALIVTLAILLPRVIWAFKKPKRMVDVTPRELPSPMEGNARVAADLPK